MGFLLALGAALAWGSYIVPFKSSKAQNLTQFQALMGAGIFISTLLACLIFKFPVNLSIYGIISGVLWASANNLTLSAIYNLSISRAIPIISSLVILSTFLLGSLFFSELPSGMLMGFLAIGLIIFGVITVSSTGENESKNTKKGLIMALLAGLIFGVQLVPLKVGNLATEEFFFPLGLGIFLTGFVIAFLKKVKFSKEAIGASLASGVIWNIGNLLSLVSISLIGLSKGMPISQTSTLIAVGWGLIYFKEISGKKKITQIIIGATILFIGIIVLSIA